MAKPLALTSGEPAGIGPDIALAAWLRRNELDLPPFYLLGDRAFFADRAKVLGLQLELADAAPEEASAALAKHCLSLQPAKSPPRAPDSPIRPARPLRWPPFARPSTMSGAERPAPSSPTRS